MIEKNDNGEVLDRDTEKMIDDAFQEWLRGEHKHPEPDEEDEE